jgi:hypothetical protein
MACPSQSLGSGYPFQVRTRKASLAGFPLLSLTRAAIAPPLTINAKQGLHPKHVNPFHILSLNKTLYITTLHIFFM